MPLLDVRGLTMRFGGLTAVNAVDFAVEKGQVFSVIGPNGAGKTTVFNAVTGVYEPTEGEILFEGRDPRRPFGARVITAMAVIGLFSGLLLALASADVNAMWRTVVVLNTPGPGEAFPLGKAVSDLWTHLHAGILVEPEIDKLADLVRKHRAGRYEIRPADSDVVLEVHDDKEVAAQRLEILRELLALAGSLRNVEPRDGRFVAVDSNGTVIQAFASRAEAKQTLMELAIKGGKLRWRLVSRVSEKPLAVAARPEDAPALQAELQEIFTSGGRVAEREGAFVVAGTAFATSAEAEQRRALLASVASDVRMARLMVWLCFLSGVGLGAGGTYAVWRRARRTPEVVARHGLARTFQNIRLFPDMLAIENVLMGMDAQLRSGVLAQALRLPGMKREEERAKAKALDLLKFVGLESRAWDVAKSLPYGDQRRLEIARAMATEPKLLLLDEPAAGMNPSETGELTKLIGRIRDQCGLTILLIEHHMKVVMGISDRVVVLDHGAKIAEGTPAEVARDPAVIEAYLGKTDEGIE